MQYKLLSIISISALLSLGAACSPVQITTNVNNTPGSWVPSTQGPWDGSLNLVTSADGYQFSNSTLVLDHAGVPNLLLLNNGTLVLTYQYFSLESEELFDVIAYSVSTDNGKTWSTTQPLRFSGIPVGSDSKKHPMDPTLVQLSDGRLRIYFTYHAQGQKTAALYSATAPDGNIESVFAVESTPSLVIADSHLLDPAVIYHNDIWHHYSWRLEDDQNYHSTSTDGITFTRQEDIELNMDFLGQVIPFNSGLRFFGTGERGIVTASSTDGYTWTMDTGSLVQGADPAIQKLPDGTYLMVFTKLNFNQPAPN